MRVNHADRNRPNNLQKLVNATRTIENNADHGKARLPVHITSRLGIAFMLLLGLSACASESVTRGAYEAVYQKGCMDREGRPNCDPDHKSYDQYKKEREESRTP